MTQALEDRRREALHRRAQHRRELRDLFRRMIADRETAERLDLRVQQLADPVAIDGLLIRAADHRLRADRARMVLVAESVLGVRLPA